MDGIEIEGFCPVQGYLIHDGWLYYFRARDGWSLRAWAPGNWDLETPPKEQTHFREAEYSLSKMTRETYLTPDVDLEEDAPGVTEALERDLPRPLDENDYPGWWSLDYAHKVMEWAIERTQRTHAKGFCAD